MDAYCGSTFWNNSRTWDTDDPDFTPCFEDTVLVWSPCLILWLCAVPEVFHFASQKTIWTRSRRVNWTRLSIAKIVLALVIFVLHLTRILWNPRHFLVFPVKWLNLIVTSASFVLFIVLVIAHRTEGMRVHTSGSHFTFWLLSMLVNVVTLRTTVKDFLSHSGTSNAGESVGVEAVVTESLYLTLLCVQFFIHCWSDSSIWEHAPLQDGQEKVCPQLSASFLSHLLFSWVTRFAVLGYRKPLETEDIWQLRDRDKCEGIVCTYNKYWKRSEPVYVQKNEGVWTNILVPLWFVIWRDLLFSQVLVLFTIIFRFAQPKILDLLIGFVQHPEEETWKGYLYAVLMLVVAILSSVCLNKSLFVQLEFFMAAQSALSPIVYRKTLTMSTNSKKEFSTGEITNLMTVDVSKIRLLFWSANVPWSCPLQLGLALYMLWEQLGPSIFVGLGILILLIPVNWAITHKLSKLQDIQMTIKDERIKLMTEILSGIKILKLYAWEPSFEEQVKNVRAKEIKNFQYQGILNSINEFVFKSVPFIVSLATFATYVYIDSRNVLDARKAFVSLALFNLMNIPIMDLPRFISDFAQARISFKRINKFLNAEENNPNAVNWTPPHYFPMTNDENLPESSTESSTDVEIENGSFTWTDASEVVLSDVNLSVGRGKLVAIVGSVGSGKSSLLSSILGEMKKLSGTVSVIDSIAYVPQIAWIRNATVKDNIMLGHVVNEEKYQKVLHCCALEPDLDILAAGDQTEIGEKGINLSGGQKQRVALARAAYHNADLYLLDDPLSAVDAHVAEHLFHKLIGPSGLLADKTRIIVTHSVTFLPLVDHIIVIKDGKFSESGTYTELQESKGPFSEFLTQHSSSYGKNQSEHRQDGKEGVKEENDTNASKLASKLMTEENVEASDVKFQVYIDYFRSIGWPLVFTVALLYGVAQGLGVGANIWLSVWAAHPQNGSRSDEDAARKMYLGVYSGLGLGQCFVFLAAAFAVYMGALIASQRLHNQMLATIMHAPMSFFDSTPLGRIVNRFSQDTDSMDTGVCWDFVEWLGGLFTFIGIVGIISATLPIFIAVVIPASGLYIMINRFYLPTTRQIFRLSSILRSPLYSHLNETLNGTMSIRAFRVTAQFIQDFDSKLNINVAALFALLCTRRWLSIRLEFLGAILVFASSIFAILSRDSISASLVGLAISYALQITDTLSWLTKVTSFLEPDMVCVERILEYGNKTRVPQEAEYTKHDDEGPRLFGWPKSGRVLFKDLSLRYREGLDLVLKKISFEVQSGEKIGVVGRTGAGKSSLTVALFRIIEAAEGSIEIDGVDISQLGLHDLRKNLTIIPQDPVLFSASLRMNLDPFNEYDDNELWYALAHAHLKTFVETLANGLEHKIAEGGENLSVGQRQLVCMARAILRKSQILILDEATAAIDLDTDELIQKTIKEEFANCTIITIAHRLNTIIDYSKILVLDQGEVKEFDTPANLLANADSFFYSMAIGAGIIAPA